MAPNFPSLDWPADRRALRMQELRALLSAGESKELKIELVALLIKASVDKVLEESFTPKTSNL